MASNTTDVVIAAFEALCADPRPQKIPEAIAVIVGAAPAEDELAASIYAYSKMLHARQTAASADVALCTKQAQILSELVAQLTAKSLVCAQTLHLFLDHETRSLLHPNVQLDENKKLERRVRTRSFYTQKNFNIYWEESEGFSQLISLLSSCKPFCSMHTSPPPDAAKHAVEQLMSIVGLFKLDVCRVIEAVLRMAADCLAVDLNADTIGGGPDNCCKVDPHALTICDTRLPTFVGALLDEFQTDHVAKVMGVILTQCDSRSASTYFSAVAGENSFEGFSRESCMLLVVVMLREKKVPLDVVWPFMVKSPSFIVDCFRSYDDTMKELARVGSAIQKKEQESEEDVRDSPDPWVLSVSERDIFCLEPSVENGPFHDVSCNALDILYISIRRCRWQDAKALISAMNGDSDEHLDVAAHPPIAKALINLAFSIVKPALHKRFPQYYFDGESHAQALELLGGPREGFVASLSSTSELFEGTAVGDTLLDILHVLGPHARRSVPLLYALGRLIGKEDLSMNQTARTIMKEVLLPALQLTSSNCALANMLWEIISRASHEVRWEMYGYMRFEAPSYCAAISVAGARASYETKSIMKRVTCDNYYKYQSAIAKSTHGQAISVFSVFIRRIQGYPPDRQAITPFVETLESCSSLSLDILMYMISYYLGDEMRSNIKDDGYNYESWFASTSLFVGIFLRKIEIARQTWNAVLHFLFRKIAMDDDMHMVSVLKDIVLCVTDIDVARSLTTRQQRAKAGGRTLRSVVQGSLDSLTEQSEIGVTVDPRKERRCTSAMLSLKRAFIATGHHFNIAVAIAQFASRNAFESDNKRLPLKMNSGTQDRIRSSMHQYSEMLDALSRTRERSSRHSDEFWGPFLKLGLAELNKLNILPADWYAIVRPVLRYTDGMLKISADLTIEESEVISKELYCAFWSLSLADLDVPEELYNTERTRFKKLISKWDSQINQTTRRGEYIMHKSKRTRGETELKRFRQVEQDLELELRIVQEKYDAVSLKLRSCGNQFEVGISSKPEPVRENAMLLFLQKCVLPRALASAADALYCLKFIVTVTKLKCIALDLPILIRCLVRVTPGVVLSSTEGDAANFGVLLREILSMLESWRSNKALFEKSQDHGFRDSNGQIWRHDAYCNYSFELHEYLTSSLCKCLSSPEYLDSRNSLTVLHLLSTVFPKVVEHGARIIEAVEIVTKSNKADLRLAATGMVSALMAGKGKRVPEHFFRLRVKGSVATHHSNGSLPSKPETKSESSAMVESETRPVPVVGSTAPVQKTGSPPKSNGSQQPIPMEIDAQERKENEIKEERPEETPHGDTHSRPISGEAEKVSQPNSSVKRPRTPDKIPVNSPSKRACGKDRTLERKGRNDRSYDRNDKSRHNQEHMPDDRNRSRDDRNGDSSNRDDRNGGDRGRPGRGRDNRGRGDRNRDDRGRNDRNRDRNDRTRGRNPIGDRTSNGGVPERGRERPGSAGRDQARENIANPHRDRQVGSNNRTPDRHNGVNGPARTPSGGNRNQSSGEGPRQGRPDDGNTRNRERIANTNARRSPVHRLSNERIGSDQRAPGISPRDRDRMLNDLTHDGGRGDRFSRGRAQDGGTPHTGENGHMRQRNSGLRDRAAGGPRDRDNSRDLERPIRDSGLTRDRNIGGNRNRDVPGPRGRDNLGRRERSIGLSRDRGNLDMHDRDGEAPPKRAPQDLRGRSNLNPRDRDNDPGSNREGAPLRDRDFGRQRAPMRGRTPIHDDDRNARDLSSRDRNSMDRNIRDIDRFEARPGDGPPISGRPDWMRRQGEREPYRDAREGPRHPPIDRRRPEGGFVPGGFAERDDRGDRRHLDDDERRVRQIPPARRRRNTRPVRR